VDVLQTGRDGGTKAEAASRAGALNHGDVEQALARIQPYVRRTPLLELELDGLRFCAKLEHHQRSGSFKFRGATNRLLVADPALPVVTASGGNHGVAVALAGARLRRQVTVFVPGTSPEPKKQAIRATGARLVEAGRFYADAEAAATEFVAGIEAVFVHPYADPVVAAGQGTCLLEALEENPRIESWVVAVGGGGLLAGSLAAAGDRVRVGAVEPIGAPTLARALAAGRPVRVEVDTVTSSALGAAVISPAALAMSQAAGVEVALVDDDTILAAQHRLWHEYRVLVEPSGAAALAAVLAGKVPADPGTCVLLCGANTDQLPTD
jgi:threonine dehydratase